MIFPFNIKLASRWCYTDSEDTDSRRCDELKEPFPVNTMYLPLKAKTKHKGATKPLRELLPANVNDKNFKDDFLNSFKEVTVVCVFMYTYCVYVYVLPVCQSMCTCV